MRIVGDQQSVAELLAFAHSWGPARRKLLDGVIAQPLVLPITARAVHDEWVRLRCHAKSNGLPIQQDHNDRPIAATANLAGLTVITSDVAGSRPIKTAGQVKVELIDSKSGLRLQ